jgi:hypothetical protein
MCHPDSAAGGWAAEFVDLAEALAESDDDCQPIADRRSSEDGGPSFLGRSHAHRRMRLRLEWPAHARRAVQRRGYSIVYGRGGMCRRRWRHPSEPKRRVRDQLRSQLRNHSRLLRGHASERRPRYLHGGLPRGALQRLRCHYWPASAVQLRGVVPVIAASLITDTESQPARTTAARRHSRPGRQAQCKIEPSELPVRRNNCKDVGSPQTVALLRQLRNRWQSKPRQ